MLLRGRFVCALLLCWLCCCCVLLLCATVVRSFLLQWTRLLPSMRESCRRLQSNAPCDPRSWSSHSTHSHSRNQPSRSHRARHNSRRHLDPGSKLASAGEQQAAGPHAFPLTYALSNPRLTQSSQSILPPTITIHSQQNGGGRGRGGGVGGSRRPSALLLEQLSGACKPLSRRWYHLMHAGVRQLQPVINNSARTTPTHKWQAGGAAGTAVDMSLFPLDTMKTR